MSLRIGVDVGGTFTDVICFDEERGAIALLKVPSTPQNPDRAVIEGTTRLLQQSGLNAQHIRAFIHGTTVATNAILERKGAQLALLVTEGFRDVLYITRQDRPRLYDYFLQRPEPLVPRRNRFGIPERVLYTGEVLRPIQEDPTRQILRHIRDQGILDIAVCLLHSYVNPIHERILARWIAEEIPDSRISLSSEILPEFKEFERMSTTVVNAYVLPKLRQYIGSLEAGPLGDAEQFKIMQSNGGTMMAQTAQTHCVHTVLSGPAAGALSGLFLGRQAGVEHVISIDVGGTSADVRVVRKGHLDFADESEIGGAVIKVPAIEICTVGAGGGSIAWIDAGGALQVGPQSAGAYPGPACYGKGGQEPTVTDANLVLGRLNPEYFLGGELAVDEACARRAIRERVAGPLGMNVEVAAEGIVRVINAVMAKAIRRLSVERGYDPRDFTLISFGGGGPLHAADLAQELQIPHVLVPPAPGVSSALGLLTADFRHDYVRTVLWKTEQTIVEQLVQVLAELQAQAVEVMQRDHVDPESIAFVPSLDMRYRGQGFSLAVRCAWDETKTWIDLAPAAAQFHDMHREAYGYSDDHTPTEIVNVRLVALGRVPCPEFPRLARDVESPLPAFKSRRRVYLNDRFEVIDVYERSRLKHGNRIQGPALVEQVDSTTLILSRQRADVDPFGNLILSLEKAE